MKQHTVYGHEALSITERMLGKSSFLRLAREIALTHHEKWDGSGYPRGLKGDAIPISGRLMAVADVYDAIISKRLYKPPLPHETAVPIIREASGSHFDPDVVQAFVELEALFRNIALTFADCEEERPMLGGVSHASALGVSPGLKKVLLAEDNPINQEIMFSQLTSIGYWVEVASNGREALKKFRSGDFDVVLTDLDMPEMDGYQLVAEIRSFEAGKGRRIPIFAITGSQFDLSAEIAEKRGFNGHMLKPLDAEVLESKLHGLQHRPSERSAP